MFSHQNTRTFPPQNPGFRTAESEIPKDTLRSGWCDLASQPGMVGQLLRADQVEKDLPSRYRMDTTIVDIVNV